MNSKAFQEVLRAAETWPPADKEELFETAREIQARHTGIYVLSDEERIAVQEGIAQADRGELVSEEEMEEFWKSLGV